MGSAREQAIDDHSFRQISIDLITRKKSKVSQTPLLEHLYYLLLQLSLSLSQSRYRCRDTVSIDISNCGHLTKIHFNDIIVLSDVIFEEILRKFEQLLCSVKHVRVMLASNRTGQCSDILIPPDCILLLRCCIKMLQILEFDQSIVLEKCRILIVALGKLCSLGCVFLDSGHKKGDGREISYFKRSISQECTIHPDGAITSRVEVMASRGLCPVKESPTSFFMEQTSLIPSLCPVLEVFADELLMHQNLRKYFLETDSTMCEKLFISHDHRVNIGTVLEVVSAHFLLSFSNELSFNKFSQSLFWSYNRDLKTPELSLSAAMVLLGTTVKLSGPQVLQAHLISLVSRCIGINMVPVDGKPNSELLLSHTSAFEISVNLYTSNLSVLHFSDVPSQANNGSRSCGVEQGLSGNGLHASLKSFIRAATYGKINLQILRFLNSCNPSLHGSFSGTRTDLMWASQAYVKENKGILDESCRDEICSILNCIILMALFSETREKDRHEIGELSLEKACLLAAILKLMSCSLLQILWFMRDYGSLKTLKDYLICKEFDFIAAVISCFGQYSECELIKRILCDATGLYIKRHTKTKPILMHFAGLLIFSFQRGPDFLWKGCIFLIMTLMSLLIFEEGNLDALKQFKKEYSFSASSFAKKPQELVCRRSSLTVALNLHKTQTLYLSEKHGPLTSMIERVETPNSCNGEPFLKTLLNTQKDGSVPPDYANLADFIVCKSGKDYADYLKNKDTFRKWAYERNALMRKRKRCLYFLAKKRTRQSR